MKALPSFLITAAAVAASVFILSALARANEHGPQPDASLAANAIERGRYLVHQAVLCVDCHSPRNEKGEFIASRHLTGAPLPFAATVPMPWTPVAPRIAGLPSGFSHEDTVHFLMTGERPNGRPPALPPMPAFRFSRADAEAITAYLQTLPAASD